MSFYAHDDDFYDRRQDWIDEQIADGVREQLKHYSSSFEDILDFVYGKDRLDTNKFQLCLDKLCEVFDVFIPEGEPNIQRKNIDENKIIHQWVASCMQQAVNQ